ncbi:MAG: PAS domain S-box protein [Methylibium sp.]|uniref:PAS domain S-box protein n=1 Tax=Methylibium sp. TaxID=2067992 RepID=UPI0017F7FA4C|nr:PAS domain S-box protein [Methylibium sp.]MBA3596924.1 PAS domain S-box protein [Methylibium sp.]
MNSDRGPEVTTLVGTGLTEALRDSEERLAAVFNSTAVGVALVALDGRFVQVNDSYCRITGYSREELSLVDRGALTHPDDRARSLTSMEALTTGQVANFDIEKRYVRKDGTPVWVQNSVSLVRDGVGQPDRVVMLCRDVTKRKRAEAILLEQKNVLELVAAGKSLQECLTAVTAAVARLQPHARAAVLLADESRTRFTSAFAQDVAASFGKGLEGAPIDEVAIGTCGTAIYTAEPVTCADVANDPKWAPHWRELCLAHGILACHSEPVPGTDGLPVASFMLCFDEAREPSDWERRIAVFGGQIASIVLERERASQTVRQAEKNRLDRSDQLRRLAEIATRLSSMHDPRSIMQAVNDEARELVAAHLCATSMTVNAEWAQAVVSVSLSDKYERWRDNEAKADGSGIYSRVSRMGRPVRLTQAELLAHPAWKGFGAHAAEHPPLRGLLAAPLTGLRGGNVGLIQLSDKLEGDFTQDDEALLVQLAQMASVAIDNAALVEELREAHRRKDEFLATLAHELRNPLAPLRNGLQVMKLARDKPEIVERARSMMERQLAQMVHLIDDLLDMSRISRGKIDLRKERVELVKIVQQAVETSRPLIEAAGHELTINLSPQRIFVEADTTRLAQVIANLLNNAAKYTEPGGHITLAMDKHDGEAVVSVRDTGMGIPQPLLPAVFEMFTQVDRGRSQGGLGIGLSLVKGLVELHGGGVEAHSEGEGRGSEFVVRLPATEADEVLLDSQHETGAPVAARRILVVDDNRDAAASLALMLGLMGNEVRTAYDGAEALETAAAFLPDTVLLDIGMPRLSGYDVCRALRQQAWGRSILVLALTGWGQEEDRRKSHEAGFDGHLVKPVDPPALAEWLAKR